MFGLPGGKIWERKNAAAGEKIYIADYPGLSKAGFIALKKGYQGFEEAKKRFLSPDPFPLFPKNINGINAAIDISDSLISEISLIAGASKVSIIVDIEKIPVHKEVIQMAERENISPEKLILSSGEEFFLLVSSSQHVENFHEIGYARVYDGTPLIVKKNGIPLDFSNINLYSHFSG